MKLSMKISKTLGLRCMNDAINTKAVIIIKGQIKAKINPLGIVIKTFFKHYASRYS